MINIMALSKQLLTLIFITGSLMSETAGQTNPPDNIGREFLLMFMENYIYGSDFPLELYFTTSETRDVHVHITSPKWKNPNIDRTFTITAGAVTRLNISEVFRMMGDSKSSKSLLVEADGDIVVYGGNKEDYSNDVYCALPTDVLGTDYYAVCYGPAFRKTEIGIAAPEDGTTVAITLPTKDPNLNVSYDGKTYQAGDKIIVKMDQYETLQLQSVADLTGSHITSDKPISVISGNIKTNIGKGQFQDHLVEQMTPVETWGKKFVTAPIPARTTGDYFRVVASEDNTVIKVNGKAPVTLAKAGDWTQLTLPSDTYNLIESDKPVLLSQFVLSQQSSSEPADPSMMIIPPYELFGADYTFATPDYSHPEFFQYLNEFLVVTESAYKDGILLDNQPLPSNVQWHAIPGTTLVGAHISVSKGSHTVRNSDPTAIFGGYLYGHAYHESYAFPTGMRLAKINKKCVNTSSTPGDGLDNDCDGQIDEDVCLPGTSTQVDGGWSDWQAWGSCSVTCEKGIQFRNRSCDHPAPKYGGKSCSGNSSETRTCDTKHPCPIDVASVCKRNKTAVVANPYNCAQYYNCSDQKVPLGKSHLQECPYPQLFDPHASSCQPFNKVTCGLRVEPQAPCDYQQNLCNGTDPSCTPCPQRLPSCIGKTDGSQEFPGRRAYPDYITCKKNRTTGVHKCSTGYFDPRQKKCQNYNAPIMNFLCGQHPTAKFVHPTNCAKFYDCSKKGTHLSDREGECKYPDLFSSITGHCENFTTVSCDNRTEPQAPCQYDQNHCPANNKSCDPCPHRLPSCIGLQDGQRAVPGEEWSGRHIMCFRNRTLSVDKCSPGYWHPVKNKCLVDVSEKDIPEFCKANPTAVIPHHSNCAKFYNCSHGNQVTECHYPDLFSVVTNKCENFTGVRCDNRTEPQAPCQYQQNLCNPVNTSCQSCPLRLPSCIGKQDGHNVFPAREWKSDYIQCFKNRTMSIQKCPKGNYFHPHKLTCLVDVDPVDVPEYCQVHPTTILPDPDNCAHYFNCSDPSTHTVSRAGKQQVPGNYRKECHYPDLFSTVSLQCEQFEKVNCTSRKEPQAPCEYQQNLCSKTNKSCVPCSQRLPNCRGLPQGDNPIPWKLWSKEYTLCYKNRTMEIKNCSTKYFHPVVRKCMDKIDASHIDDMCKRDPSAVLSKGDNCAQYYNCSASNSALGGRVQECHYPDLFSTVTKKCENFTGVKCDNRTEPQAPCEYQQNLCSPTNVTCPSCPLRLPSCIGQQDGRNVFPTREWRSDYIQCFKNRTMDIQKCVKGKYFHPHKLTCLVDVDPVDVPDYCQSHPTAILPDPDNCAHYFNCSYPSIHTISRTGLNQSPGNYRKECHYPDLFSTVSLQCEQFEKVNCTSRKEPQAPCEYQQNLCSKTNKSCVPCSQRLPNCRGLPQGDNPVSWKLWSKEYTVCYKNRTMDIKNCSTKYFHPVVRKCMDKIDATHIDDMCKRDPSAILSKGDNCAQYYNCSASNSLLGGHVQECHYPDLFSAVAKKCENFTGVKCDNRTEPQAPCEYQQNLCSPTNVTCPSCPLRLPSCIGQQDGRNVFPTHEWKSDYIQCFKNRTMDIQKCAKGKYFHPRKLTCLVDVDPVDVPDYCQAHPTAILPDPDYCAHYFNCSDSSIHMISRAGLNQSPGNYRKECHYPDLFSTLSLQCEQFENVNCTTRKEPQAPCEYQQNLCGKTNKSCVPCSQRLPNCRGLPKGDNPIPWKLWSKEYTVCYKNRTMDIKNCTTKYFHPVIRKCMNKVDDSHIDDICKRDRTAILSKGDNCAQYYNCSMSNSVLGGHLQECHYPDLFSMVTKKCGNFTGVKCDNRTEPQAPCEYQQNLCNSTDPNCLSCPLRLPSCIGQQDGHNVFPTREWKSEYIHCFRNRTLDVQKCPKGKYFHPRKLTCLVDVDPVDVPDYCQVHPTAILPDPDNCAHYFNCSDHSANTISRAAPTHTPDNYRKECHYPDLFSIVSLQCEPFETVNCTTRKEPQAPCEYQQNLCSKTNQSCVPCSQRLPSCVGLPKGDNPIPWKLWRTEYTVCYKNRTMDVKNCTTKYFHPVVRKCTNKVDDSHIDDICKRNPTAILSKGDNCAQYYNCSVSNSLLGGHVQECNYPDLFSTVTKKCENFTGVKCDNRTEPQAPCEYQQNLCNSTDTNCLSCPLRLPSCIGERDGQNLFPTREWMSDYIKCFKNRTMDIQKCPKGKYFHPRKLVCFVDVDPVDVPDYCKVHPTAILPDPDNCAHYFNCSDPSTHTISRAGPNQSPGNYRKECHYPDLFSNVSLQCEQFEKVNCTSRKEPQAPCEYQQNLCSRTNKSCVPCSQRLPSCRGLPNGDNPIHWKRWSTEYTVCYKNRTMDIKNCTTKYFHPVVRKCMNKVETSHVDDICKRDPTVIFSKGDNCAQYYNCSVNNSPLGGHVQECHYPDLFSMVTKTCENFTGVKCDNRTEPQAPCEYQQNLCNPANTSCLSCPLRLPSCIGQQDGHNVFPTREWKSDYIQCFMNRTIDIQKCPKGKYFHPRKLICLVAVDPVDVPDYCHAHPTAILPDPDNCAHYFNCSDPSIQRVNRASSIWVPGSYRKECHYPDLFNTVSAKCENFTSVTCNTRPEPQAPCEYQQNLCQPTNTSCETCPKRLPSCKGKSDGAEPFHSKLWLRDYIICFRNRTMKIKQCPIGQYFNPRTKLCSVVVVKVDVPDYCQVHPTDILPDPDNCAKFYNCSRKHERHEECKYPDLFSSSRGHCQRFMTVACHKRHEPQAPCEYDQNLCNATSTNCAPCIQRLPSCVGLPDGEQPVVGELWQSRYVTCLQNRTMAINHCPQGSVFDPNQLRCVNVIPQGNIDDFCKANPQSQKPHPLNCGQYYNCSSKDMHHLKECHYPDLFDPLTLTCENFTSVVCDSKQHEPQAPCEYLQNHCASTNKSCPPCPTRLPSCIGHPDGLNPYPNELWHAKFILCYKNRTMNISKCNHGYFHPRKLTCTKNVDPVDVPDYCTANPTDILPKPSDCSNYYNCSDTAVPRSLGLGTAPARLGRHERECPYPDLFDTTNKVCQNFTKVQCHNRSEPQAPCDYEQYLCQPGDVGCRPCPTRLPSCVGEMNGPSFVPGKRWTAEFMKCYLNRTTDLNRCTVGEYFHPVLRLCKTDVDPVDVPDYCQAHPTAILPDPDNCAHYFNCSDPSTHTTNRASPNQSPGNYRKECHYPDLFSPLSRSCKNFTAVKCTQKKEPQAPCEYDQNICDPLNKTCLPCPKRLPSCKGLADGPQAFPGRHWERDYIVCYKNRTMSITKCLTGTYFNLRLRQCETDVPTVDVPAYCQAHPHHVLPDLENCAKLYNCSAQSHHKECHYPDLFSISSHKCERFLSVLCDHRLEPQAPCDYDQNLCNATSTNCAPCIQRLPSCVGLPDGDQPVVREMWQSRYVTCLQNRTMAVNHCPQLAVFDPNQLRCVNNIPQNNLNEFCKANHRAVKPHPTDCAQYYNCSATSVIDGQHLFECPYPDLFDAHTLQCARFQNVKCDKKQEPMAPCDYVQNLCNNNDKSCLPCPVRLPSCVGLPDGHNPYPTKIWKTDYIVCDHNRTVNITKCLHGYFHPRQLTCNDAVLPVDVPDYCHSNPTAILPDPDNCAQFFNCSATIIVSSSRRMPPRAVADFTMECSYPDLYDKNLGMCKDFETVTCITRPEPQAPCEYEQNLCSVLNSSCVRCPDRLPSCVGEKDGQHRFPGKEWLPDYIVCRKNRTINITSCVKDLYFNPRLQRCMSSVQTVDVPGYCSVNKMAILPDLQNCAKYFNCSDNGGAHVECHYPDLFSMTTKSCTTFTSVNCQSRLEPQAPCNYTQNLCLTMSSNCAPCPERLPSCVGKHDGHQPFTGKLWSDQYITCYKNRTVDIQHCPLHQYFHPRTRKCLSNISPVDVLDYCQQNPDSLIAAGDNCAHFYNCSKSMSRGSVHPEECLYPDLFSQDQGRCQQFTMVTCKNRTEPQTPCEYSQNLCIKRNNSCSPCPDRLPSCVGMSDGKHTFPGKEWQGVYITCYRNRTMGVHQCPNGQYFHIRKRMCLTNVEKVDIPNFCKANPRAVIPSQDNCAHFYNCSNAAGTLGAYMNECHYPDLFSKVTRSCDQFQVVLCGPTYEPQAPCEYQQNICPSLDPNCAPCPERLPSCVGKHDGIQPFTGKLWTPAYVVCLQNRTIDIKLCPSGSVFNPNRLQCVDDIAMNNIANYCRANPRAIKPHPTNCAQFVDCSIKRAALGSYVRECHYPDLFSESTLSCQNFTTVTCNKTEPQAPCEYVQNLCDAGDNGCLPCPQRLASCIGLPDGANPFPRKLWKKDYIICFHNRTLDTKQCSEGEYFHPRRRLCTQTINTVDVPDYCHAHPGDILPDPYNCAQYYNCSAIGTTRRMVTMAISTECTYPDLFSKKTHQCERFTTVTCQNRTEPQAPCAYRQNRCEVGDLGCTLCSSRLPSCVGLPDGRHAFPGREWESVYIVCYLNRTTDISKCPSGYFHPVKEVCMSKIGNDEAPDYCKAHSTAILPKGDNCAQYYNCSEGMTKYGKHTQECKYPDLFSRTTGSCLTFTNVNCDSRFEPQAPCEYKQNLCTVLEPNCSPCSERLPSCVGLEDGPMSFPGREWTNIYIQCQMNRTIAVSYCPPGEVFDPSQTACIDHVSQQNLVEFCKANPSVIQKNPSNCGQYINCSDPNSIYGKYIGECTYPDLFSDVTGSCESFQTVGCTNRPEPQAPCEYQQNLCQGASHCIPCSERLPSCGGLPDGLNEKPKYPWTEMYIKCFHNRTIMVDTCLHGYFNPRTKQCLETVDPVDVPDYCLVHPDEILPNPHNCAQYYNCSDEHTQVDGHLMECPYPDLFSMVTRSCKSFTSVYCYLRYEPQAPCDYEQNSCHTTDLSCTPCLQRLPSCVGLSGGDHSYPGKQWSHDFITCLQNRTIDIKSCPANTVFHPDKHTCVDNVPQSNIEDFCKANPMATKPHPSNCAQYYNCSADPSKAIFGSHGYECTYPRLYSQATGTCEDFELVTCSPKHEPQAPCEYLQNTCKNGDRSYLPCPERLPSCVGLADGDHMFPGKPWQPEYITCHKNRTINTIKCQTGLFHPVSRTCVLTVTSVYIPSFCSAHPYAILPKPDNCAQYYQCSDPRALLGVAHLKECPYPEIFSARRLSCDNFTRVHCDGRMEPMAPCQYLQNLCLHGNTSCQACPDRLPSCVGLPDGYNAILSRQLSKKYIQCFSNRTIAIKTCKLGLFDPSLKKCSLEIEPDNIVAYCQTYPDAVFPHQTNCAQYYNCSSIHTRLGNYLHECPYPALFSVADRACHNFTTVSCGVQFEPQAPCEYLINHVTTNLLRSLPCPERLPSCIGLPDGLNMFPGQRWTNNYVICYKNRTIDIKKCEKGFYDPYRKLCVQYISKMYLLEYCGVHPRALIASEDNCAWYYNCAELITGAQPVVKECTYPDLFSTLTMRCESFSAVTCGQRIEPQSPCEYRQNQCTSQAIDCLPCPERLPSCVGLPQGPNPILGHLWSATYITCDRNRTLGLTHCSKGQLFDPQQKKCEDTFQPGTIADICTTNRYTVLPDSTNCAHYYNCSLTPSYRTECKYPKLFSLATMSCQNFHSVQCGARPEPQAPCQYDQNLCKPGYTDCRPCQDRLPSCVGLPDGLNAFPGMKWARPYIICDMNRTVEMKECASGYFHPIQRICVQMLHPADVQEFCAVNKHKVISSSVNAAQYYNCSQIHTDLGHYLLECPYPQLFSRHSQICLDFRQVAVDTRPVPQAPCQYLQFQCLENELDCLPCATEHHSCIGLPDGDNPITGRTWTDRYVTCLWNRTIAENQCEKGVFDPNKRVCTLTDHTDQIKLYCTNHPKAIVKHPGDCALYYNCSETKSLFGLYVSECPYPDLFSTLTHRCEPFIDVQCPERHEPQAPCEYLRNHCNASNTECVPCPMRLPSCISLPDGFNAVPGHFWSKTYIQCYKNRTMSTFTCEDGYFDPRLRTCTKVIDPEYASEFCATNPEAIVGSSRTCAQYVNCTATDNVLMKECPYPDLFSPLDRKCLTFTKVHCETIYEPQAPCEYKQNQCNFGQPSCFPCVQRFTSCVGLPDGMNAVPGHHWTVEYVQCYKNRTMFTGRCQQGYFDPETRKCVTGIGGEGIGTFCAANHDVKVPNPLNCAQYYDCSRIKSVYQPYLHECTYPQLFSSASLQCVEFTQVSCGMRAEPMAPCQYLQNQCPSSDPACRPCPLRLPSCLGLPDGANAIPSRLTSSQYVQCYRNRTIGTLLCPFGYFDKNARECVKPLTPTEVSPVGICANRQNGAFSHPSNCAKYYTCFNQSQLALHECPYPKLFSRQQKTCQDFEYVSCDSRYEPQTPCEYTENLCKSVNTSCTPCPERSPSCRGLPEGDHPFPGRLWTSDYITCHKNRTVFVGKCCYGNFDPKLRSCTDKINPLNVASYCLSHPGGRLPKGDNCAQYYDCSHIDTSLGTYLEECPYPDLFNVETLQCESFTQVNCSTRYIPQSPCEYEVNWCRTSDCVPCLERFSICVGKPDGPNALKNSLLFTQYVNCYKNRTLETQSCTEDMVFNPKQHRCVPVDNGYLENICFEDFGLVHPHPYSCAQFIDCSGTRPGYMISTYLKECEYPQIFSTDTLECVDYHNTTCGDRHLPQAPCEYLQNHCHGDDPFCEPCVDRLPSCIGFPDGENPIMGLLWTQAYMECKENRTLGVSSCLENTFNPYLRECVEDNTEEYCRLHPSGILAHPNNCGQYYNCSRHDSRYGHYLQECSYPNLFSATTLQCEHYTKVNCDGKIEPVAPCDYIQNQCLGPHCGKCSDNHPSCDGLADGANPFPGQMTLSPLYVLCEGGRTLSIQECKQGVFDPHGRMCVSTINTGVIHKFCETNPDVVIPSLESCAQFYACGSTNTQTGTYLHECVYPKLYDITTGTCRNFSLVQCGDRKEPQAPCDYIQYQCAKNNKSCLSCDQRLPSCVDKKDGLFSVFKNKLSTSYFTCLRNRTVAIETCPNGYFEPVVSQCLPIVFYGTIPFINGEVCTEELVSGPNKVDNSKMTASSVYLNNTDPKHDYSAARGRINNTEFKDASGKTAIGAWSADQNNVNQYIQVELKDPTLIRGVVTQGRNGCCKQWVKKYRVLYSLDCKTNWKPVGGPNTTDAFFKGNSDEDTPETNIFDCPVLAKCVRINPLEWNNHISMRFDLLGCSLATAANNNASAMVSMTTTQQTTTGATSGASSSGSSMSTGGSTVASTILAQGGSTGTTTGSSTLTVTQQNSGSTIGLSSTGAVITTGASQTTTVTTTSGGSSVQPQAVKKKCIKDCKGERSKEYKHCTRCDMYVHCSWGVLYERPCPQGLEWNDKLSVCDWPTNAKCKIP